MEVQIFDYTFDQALGIIVLLALIIGYIVWRKTRTRARKYYFEKKIYVMEVA